MRTPLLAAAGLVTVLALPAAAAPAGGPGPFAGQVVQGETDTHVYRAGSSPCIQIAVQYAVTLTYAPTSDTLTLSAGTQTVTGANGTATATVWGSPCSQITIGVTGTSVASTATYAVAVTRSVLPPLS